MSLENKISEQSSVSMQINGARIAIYDDLLSAPRVIDIPPQDPMEFIESIAEQTYEHAQASGGSIPYTIIREVTENFIHAHFCEPTISILDKGNTIRFSDQGPGIKEKELAQKPGFTSATKEMKQYIRGVGSGLPIIKEYLMVTGGSLVIEDNIQNGAVLTISMNKELVTKPTTSPQTYFVPSTARLYKEETKLDDRELLVLKLITEIGAVGPTDLNNELGIAIATAHRILASLESRGLIEMSSNRKRTLTDKGYELVKKQ
jgi:predicted transcriptional regulator/anti-sigma regulatory factor (Ser/Thr protein kinase)